MSPVRGDSSSGDRRRVDGESATVGLDLTNARTRIVGTRTGVAADGVVVVVRALRAVRRVIAGITARLGSAVTPLGWTVTVLAPLCLVLGHLLGWVEFVVIGVAGLVLMVTASVNLVGRPGIAVDLDVAHDRVVVGDGITVQITARNTARRRVFGSAVELPVGDTISRVLVPTLARGAGHTHEFTVPANRRGELHLGPVRSIRADPIGLVRREIEWGVEARVVVHPRTIPVPSTSTGLIRDLEGSTTRELTASDLSFHALREYVPGDDRRHIHWKSTAKAGTHMVRQFEQTRRSDLVIALSLADADYASDDEFELAVGVAGSIGARAVREGREVSVIVSGLTPEFAKRKVHAVRELATVTPTRLLDELAVVEHEGRALGIADTARVGAERMFGASVVFMIVGSTPTAATLRAASARFPAGVEVVAVVCDTEGVPGMARVAGLTVLRVGYLEDLKAAMSRIRMRTGA